MPFAPGLSPHGRGKPKGGFASGRRGGSIPARAGETAANTADFPRCWVYPRTGGGNFPQCRLVYHHQGLSPHGRGKHNQNLRPTAIERSIPARAGETHQPIPSFRATEVYPRTGGGNCISQEGGRKCQGLSPHGRGKLNFRYPGWGVYRSIPARAGETTSGIHPPPADRVYPRTGGGNSGIAYSLSRSNGLSPHGRGKP